MYRYLDYVIETVLIMQSILYDSKGLLFNYNQEMMTFKAYFTVITWSSFFPYEDSDLLSLC